MSGGTLEKLLVRAYSAPDYAESSLIDTFESYVNPHEITLAYEMEYDSAQGSGTTGSRMDFKKVKPGDMSLAFFLDGTGANGVKIDVQTQVEKFQNVTGYNGDIHRPNYLKIAWGTIQIKRCVLKSASIVYKLFKANGTPLRATISATFVDAVADQTRVALAQDSSPDLTHVRVLRAGQTLAGLCQQIYGDAALYLKVARANQLDSFRHLPPGTRVRFPPLQK
jgi:Contractile injection system tube protein